MLFRSDTLDLSQQDQLVPNGCFSDLNAEENDQSPSKIITSVLEDLAIHEDCYLPDEKDVDDTYDYLMGKGSGTNEAGGNDVDAVAMVAAVETGEEKAEQVRNVVTDDTFDYLMGKGVGTNEAAFGRISEDDREMNTVQVAVVVLEAGGNGVDAAEAVETVKTRMDVSALTEDKDMKLGEADVDRKSVV